MSLAETAELAVRLTLNDRLTGPLRSATGAVRGFESRTGLLSKGVTNLANNMAKLGAVGVAGIVSQVKFGLDSLRELESLGAQTQAVITSTGGAAGLTATQIRGMAEELEKLTTIDDKAIQSAENLLLTFTSIGKDTFPDATLAVLNMATAMGTDLDQAAIQVGKALQDPILGMTALRRSGVSFSKEQVDTVKAMVKTNRTLDAQRLILKELERQFGGSAAAAADTFDGRMRRVGDAVEDAQKALAVGFLPVIEKVAGRLQTFLGDPANIARIERFGRDLADTLDGLLTTASKLPWDSIRAGLEGAATASRVILDAFLSLPPWVQTAVVTGWGLNKLTGGVFGSLVGELGKGLVKGVLGMNAGVVNITAGTVNGGGIGGAAGGAKSGIGGAIALGATAVGGVAAAAGVAELQNAVANALSENNPKQAEQLNRVFDMSRQATFGPFETLRTLPDILAQLTGTSHETKSIGTKLSSLGNNITRDLGPRLTNVAQKTAANAVAIGAVAGSIRAMRPPQVHVTVPVSVRTNISVRESQRATATFSLFHPPTTIQHQ